LALDTLYAEGQRRYVESLSSYARQFLGQMEKPKYDQIRGLPPTIAIEQKSASSNPRSTVGTVTEIYCPCLANLDIAVALLSLVHREPLTLLWPAAATNDDREWSRGAFRAAGYRSEIPYAACMHALPMRFAHAYVSRGLIRVVTMRTTLAVCLPIFTVKALIGTCRACPAERNAPR
jgi:hypothetical protein